MNLSFPVVKMLPFSTFFWSCSTFSLLNVMFSHYCSAGEEDEIIFNVECHYAQAKVAGFTFNIGDCAYVKVVICYLSIFLLPFVRFSL